MLWGAGVAGLLSVSHADAQAPFFKDALLANTVAVFNRAGRLLAGGWRARKDEQQRDPTHDAMVPFFRDLLCLTWWPRMQIE